MWLWLVVLLPRVTSPSAIARTMKPLRTVNAAVRAHACRSKLEPRNELGEAGTVLHEDDLLLRALRVHHEI